MLTMHLLLTAALVVSFLGCSNFALAATCPNTATAIFAGSNAQGICAQVTTYGWLACTGQNTDPAPFSYLNGKTNGVTSMAFASQSTCYIELGAVHCIGENDYAQLGLGLSGETTASFSLTTTVSLAPGLVPQSLTANDYGYCVLYTNNSASCWGLEGASGSDEDNGFLRNIGYYANEMGPNLPFVDVGTGRSITSMASASTVNCAVLDNGQIKCWGNCLAQDNLCIGYGGGSYYAGKFTTPNT